MNENFREQARQLASRPYAEELALEKTLDGHPMYLFTHPDLPGCMAQGRSIKEAKKNLENATVEYILSLLEDGLPVPSPKGKAAVTADAASVSQPIMGQTKGSGQSRAQPHKLYEVSLQIVS